MTTGTAAVPDVIVVGGGLIGAGVAWRAARAGVRVTLIDPRTPGAASPAAAGMLAPVTEFHYGEESLLRLNLESAARYPGFIAELEDAAGLPAGYRETGTLAVAFDADDRRVLKELHAFQSDRGLTSRWLDGPECRALEPMLSPRVQGGLAVDDDHQVDNRMLQAALKAAIEHEKTIETITARVDELVVEHDSARGVRLDDGRTLRAEKIVLSAGCWSTKLPGLPPGVLPAVRPVKGQIIRLAMPEQGGPFLSRNVRGVVRGGHPYLVPRAHGELVLGATMEELGYDTTVTAGGVYELLRDARELVPGITELPLVETRAGLRPATADNAPLLGPTSLPGLIAATGHHRNGVLLTPITADTIGGLLATGEVADVIAPFTPYRFSEEPAR